MKKGKWRHPSRIGEGIAFDKERQKEGQKEIKSKLP